jgi:preprotein translocase subunit SecE
MHVKMTRIESGVTVPKGLFSLYINVKIVTAKIFCHLKKMCKPYFIVIMITVLIMIGIFWVVNFKTRNYFVIFYYTDV